ncbi:MAG: mechanosensitive ion channel family protein [Acidobacteria bacterium]|nr:mechanosensitive ion channel family protein [Acidobacteriota bacterium]
MMHTGNHARPGGPGSRPWRGPVRGLLGAAALLVLLLNPLPLGAQTSGEEPGELTPAAAGTPAEPSLEEQAAEIAARTQESWAVIEGLLRQRVKTREMEELQIIDAQLDLRVGALKKHLGQLMDVIEELDAQELPSEKPKKVARRILRSARRLLWQNLKRDQDAVRLQTEKVRKAPPEERLAEERELTTLSDSLSSAYRSILVLEGYQQRLGTDVTRDLATLDRLLSARLERVAGELKVSTEKLDALKSKLEEARPEEAAALKEGLPALEEAHHRAVRELTDLVALGQRRALDVDRYKKLLIQSTGAASVGMLNKRVAVGLLVDAFRDIKDHLVKLTPLLIFRSVVFVVIVLLFWIVARVAAVLVRKTINRPGAHMPQLLRGTVVTATRNTILIIGIVVALSQSGVKVAPILAGLGIAGFIVGFALQDTLSNFAAGLMILIYRPFDVGDAVDTAGVFGKVVRVSVVSTTVDTFDNQRHIIPNRQVWGNVITNRTARETRRVDLTLFTGYGADVEQVEQILQEVVATHPKVLEEPSPVIRLQRVTESGLEFVARPWAATADYWSVFRDLTRTIKMRFDAEGVPPPTPRREIFLREHDGER